MRPTILCITLLTLAGLPWQADADANLRHFSLGDFSLESGEKIDSARLAYRTEGQLNSDSSNVILVPTWFNGTSAAILEFMVGPDSLLDSSKFFVIAVGAFGNSVSSSPSNSQSQRGDQFPRFSIRDLVEAQHRLLTQGFGLPRVHAIVGGSMGAMQALQWMVSYPDFMDKVVSIAGTPRQTSYDLLLWQTHLWMIEAVPATHRDHDKTMRAVLAIHTLALQTPQYHIEETSPDSFGVMVAEIEAGVPKLDPENWASQLRAMFAHDIYETVPDGDESIADHVKAQVMLIVGSRDHMVNPGPSRRLATQLGIETLEIDNSCGHLAFGCGGDAPFEAVIAFLHIE